MADRQRTFRKRVTVGAACGLCLLVIFTFWAFWSKMVLLGLVLLVVTVAALERVLHSEYVITEGMLVVRYGRFAREKRVKLADIKSYRRMKASFGLGHYLLITYGDNRLLAVEPVDERAFLKELEVRE